VVHVYQVAAYALADRLFDSEVVGEPVSRIKEQLDQFAAAKARPGVNSTARLCEGIPYVEIVRTAKDAAADMIVIATHGRTGLNHLLVSSVAERLVRTCSTPGRAGLSPAALMGGYLERLVQLAQWLGKKGERCQHATLCGSPCSRRTARKPMTSAFTRAGHAEANRRATSKAVVWSM
jgi:Universal stress protein family